MTQVAQEPARRIEWRFTGEAMASSLALVVSAAPGLEAAAGPGWEEAAGTASLAERAWERTLALFEEAEQALSRFRGSSDLTALNRRTGQRVEVRRVLGRALAAADRAHRRTGGRFDPRVLVALERIGYPGAAVGAASTVMGLPDVPSLRRAGDRVVRRLGRHAVQAEVPVDLGGIGKGLGLRWAANALARDELAPVLAAGGGFLLDAGQDIVTRGDGPGPAGGWLVDIEDPARPADALAVIAVPGGWAITTSSTRARHWTAPTGRPVHHLIDPRTGEPGGEGLVAVTVAGRDPAWAEVWSKSLFLDGAAGIGQAARRHGLAAWWVTTDGDLEMTPAARPLTAWLRAA